MPKLRQLHHQLHSGNSLLRLTPQNALLTSRQLLADLLRWFEESGDIAPASLRDSLIALHDTFAGNWLPVQCAVDRAALAQLLPAGSFDSSQDDETLDVFLSHHRAGGLRLRPVSLNEPPAQRAGSLAAAVLLFDSKQAEEDDNFLDSYLIERPVSIFVGPKAKIDPQWAEESWSIETAETLMELSMTTFGRLIQPNGEALYDALLSYSVVSSLDSVSTAADLSLDAELRGMKAKKALVQQRVLASQQKGASSTRSTEVVTELRARIQRHFTDFERGITERLQRLFLAHIGEMWSALEDRLSAIQSLSSAKHGGKVALEIHSEAEDALVDEMRRLANGKFSSDLIAMRDMFRVVQSDFENFLESRGAPPVMPQFQFLQEDRIRRLLDNTLILQRRYSGEIKHSGFMETFMASRRYLSILFMALSSFGLLSIFRRSPAIMVPISFVVLTIGGLLAVNASRKERAEAQKAELEKAHELYRSEFKRIFTELQRGWATLLQQHLQDQLGSVLSRAEVVLRDFQGRQANEANDEKQRIQRQLQNLETLEKRQILAAKGRDTVGKAITQARGELKQLVLSLLKQPVSSPTANATSQMRSRSPVSGAGA